MTRILLVMLFVLFFGVTKSVSGVNIVIGTNIDCETGCVVFPLTVTVLCQAPEICTSRSRFRD